MRTSKTGKKEFGEAALKDQPERYRPGRRCKICHNPLSIYNGDDKCRHHRTEDEEVMERIVLCPLKTRIGMWKNTKWQIS